MIKTKLKVQKARKGVLEGPTKKIRKCQALFIVQPKIVNILETGNPA